MQFYLEFNPHVSGVDFESSAFANASDQLAAIAKHLGLPSHFELFSCAAQNDLCPPEHQETEIPWFDPKVGIDWLEAIVTHIRSNRASVPNADELLADLSQCADVLRRAKAEGSKWHFAMDI